MNSAGAPSNANAALCDDTSTAHVIRFVTRLVNAWHYVSEFQYLLLLRETVQ